MTDNLDSLDHLEILDNVPDTGKPDGYAPYSLEQFLQETEWREEDHPREPEGTSVGGRFESKDGGVDSESDEYAKLNISDESEGNYLDVKSYANNDKIKILIDTVLPEYERYIETIRSTWNELDDDFKSGIDQFNIVGRDFEAPDAVGTYNHKTKTVGIHLNNWTVYTDSTDEKIKQEAQSIMIHEVAHSKYMTYDDEAKYQWYKQVIDMPPITKYLERFQEFIKKYKEELEPLTKRRDNQFKIIDENNAKIRAGVSPEVESDLRSDTKFREFVINDMAENYNKLSQQVSNSLDVFANETHSEFMVLHKGAKTLWQADDTVYKMLVPIYDETVGKNKWSK